jgi:Tle cognate immunity protein 4 C-terminal domain/Tle cognate immunity protein 4 N-terminal domain
MSFWLRFQILKFSIAASLCAMLISCKPTPTMNETESKTMSELTQNMQTYCIGRYLVDVPTAFKVGTSQAVGYKRNVVIDSLGKMSKAQFDARMKLIETEYAAKRHRKGWKYLYEMITVSPEVKIFHRLEDDNENTQRSRAIEGYRWSNGFTIKMVTEASDVNMVSGEIAKITLENENDVPQKIARITELLSKVQGREANVVPKEPGFCFEDGFLPGKAGDGKELEVDEELRAAFFENKQLPDVGFVFETSTEFTQETTLLQGKDLNKLLAVKNATVLRKGSVSLVGTSDTEEWLVHGDTDNGNLVNGKQPRGHYFKILGNPKVSSPLTPRVELVMRTGRAVRADESSMSTTFESSLSDAQALALWDAVSRSIRLREGQK